jgi:3-hydroxymyristoyl/3-hydroxydecanoyl-(acyl carrier protein) dehydratase
MDLNSGELLARRSFSHEKDLWLAEHKTIKFIQNPIISGIMVVETFLEAARVLYPYLEIRKILDLRLMDVVECSPEKERPVLISCRSVKLSGKEIACDMGISLPSSTDQEHTRLSRMPLYYQARIIVGDRRSMALDTIEGMPVEVNELDTRAMERAEIIEKYEEKTYLNNRYRLMEVLDGTGPGGIRGHFIYRNHQDFCYPRHTYQYPLYLLEGLLQTALFYVTMRNEEEKRSMIPFGIGEIVFAGPCRDGQRITTEARMTASSEEGFTWNARAVDKSGTTLMTVRAMETRWFMPGNFQVPDCRQA